MNESEYGKELLEVYECPDNTLMMASFIIDDEGNEVDSDWVVGVSVEDAIEYMYDIGPENRVELTVNYREASYDGPAEYDVDFNGDYTLPNVPGNKSKFTPGTKSVRCIDISDELGGTKQFWDDHKKYDYDATATTEIGYKYLQAVSKREHNGKLNIGRIRA